MTNTQLYLAIGIPMLVFIGSMIVSLVQISGIREDMRQLRTEFGTLRSEVHADLAAIRQDIQTLTGKVYEMMGQKS
jgi:CHASE3 domain sensor protein